MRQEEFRLLMRSVKLDRVQLVQSSIAEGAHSSWVPPLLNERIARCLFVPLWRLNGLERPLPKTLRFPDFHWPLEKRLDTGNISPTGSVHRWEKRVKRGDKPR